jgi:hypothetical protein
MIVVETAADAFSMCVVFERVQASTRVDNVAAGFLRLLSISVASKEHEATKIEVRRRQWTELGTSAFIYADCTPAPEGSFTQAVTNTLVEARRQAGPARQNSVQELSCMSPKLMPSINKPAPAARTVTAGAAAAAVQSQEPVQRLAMGTVAPKQKPTAAAVPPPRPPHASTSASR